MSKIVCSDNSKHVEIESIAEFQVIEINSQVIDYTPYNVVQVVSSPMEGMEYLDKEQLQYFITRLQQMEKLLFLRKTHLHQLCGCQRDVRRRRKGGAHLDGQSNVALVGQ